MENATPMQKFLTMENSMESSMERLLKDLWKAQPFLHLWKNRILHSITRHLSCGFPTVSETVVLTTGFQQPYHRLTTEFTTAKNFHTVA